MFELGAHFKIDYSKALSKEEAIIKGECYRITILTERLVRLEYNKDGKFFDDLTEQVINRNFDVPVFRKSEDANYLEIETKYFYLKYAKNKPFEGLNIEIKLLNTDKIWDPKNKEIRNFKTTGNGFINSKIDYDKGLYSTDGFVTLDDSKSMVYTSEGYLVLNNEKRYDTYVFMYKRDFGFCLRDYFILTGYPELLPRYALGIWWSKNEAYNFENIKELVGNFNKHKIPLSVLLLDEYWHIKDNFDKERYKTGFTFNRSLIPDPVFLTKYLHERGIKLGLKIDPSEGIYPHEDAYDEIAKLMNLMDRSTIPFNVFDKTSLISYFNYLINPLKQKGVDFFWLNYEKAPYKEAVRALTHYQMKNEERSRETRSMLMASNTLLASHHNGVLYSGETTVSWDTLNNIPFFNSLASNKGLSWWSHDIGGYKDGIEDQELYMRYIELGCFSPIFRLASKGGKYYKREPWKWDVKTLNIVKTYARMRHELIPYLYSENYKYHKIGLPLVQPLYYNNPEIYDEPEYKNEYLFGTELLVAPITNKKDQIMNRTIKRIFLPEGTFYDFKTGKKFPGNKRYVAFFKDEDFPVFAKSGSIIPMQVFSDNINDTSAPKEMEIHIFPGKSNVYKLYEDDGISSLYKEGYYIVTSIDYNYLQNNYTVIIRPVEGKTGIIPNTRDYKIRFRNTRQADDVIVYENNEIIEKNCYVDDTDFIVEVKNIKTTSQLTINCKGKDIEIDTVRLINEDIDTIINDLQIETSLKEKLANIIFNSELNISHKRIEIRKLKKQGLDSKFVRMFLRLMEYASEI